jgi:hypothetical protein
VPDERMSVSVLKPSFMQGIRTLAKLAKPNPEAEVVFFREGRELVISAVGGSHRMPIEGNWEGQVRVSSDFLRLLTKVPPTASPVIIAVEGDKLRIGTSKLPCITQLDVAPPIEIPHDPPLHVVLALECSHSREEIERSGLLPTLENAQSERDRLLEQAADTLNPLGVKQEDLRLLIDRCVRRANGLL